MYRIWYFSSRYFDTPTDLYDWETIKRSLERFPLIPGEYIIYEG